MKQLRESIGLTAFKLAVLSDVSLSTINRMEQGKRPVSRLTANKVAHALSQQLGREIKPDEIDGLKVVEEPRHEPED
jgi:transcriptional regulator with XRE-family HTH domain